MKKDKWGDEGEWETVIDFTKIRKGGVPADEVLAALRKMPKNKMGRIKKRKHTRNRSRALKRDFRILAIERQITS